MKKRILKSALIAVAGIGLMAGSTLAAPIPWTEAEVGTKLDDIVLLDGYSWNASDYWSLSDLTSGVSGDSTFEIRLENAGYESAFGLYLVDDFSNPTTLGDSFEVFAKNSEVGAEQSVYFKEDSGVWSVSLGTSWTEFDSSFGFYYDVYTGGVTDDSLDYRWFTDKQFNQRANGTAVDTGIEHAVVAYKESLVGTGGNVRIFLDDQLGGGDRDFTDMTVSANDLQPVPEPATMLLFGTGLAGLAGLRRKKGQKKA